MTGCCANRGAWYKDTVSFSATLTTITISTAIGSVAVGYILLGMQQWGYTHIQNTTTTINLPISFTQGFTLVCVTSVTTRGSWAAGKLINNAQAAIGSRGADFYTAEDVGWIASGMYKQQWGYNQSYRAGVDYPIAFTQIAIGTFAQKKAVDSPAGIAFELTNLHGARIYGTAGADIEGYYIVVGI